MPDKNVVNINFACFRNPQWQEMLLSKVADVRFSNVDKLSVEGEAKVRLCNYTDVYNNDYITSDMSFMEATATVAEIRKFGLQTGDAIITKDSETPDDIGIPAVVDSTAPDIVCGYHLALIRPDQNLVDPTFLAKQLAHDRLAKYFGQQANGSTRYGLSTAAIERTPLKLPTIEYQNSASDVMRIVDHLIRQTEAVIAKLKQIRTGLLHDLLTRGLDENGELRDPVEHPELFRDSVLGRIPEEWGVDKLTDLCTHIGSGVTPRGGQDVYSKSGILLIRSQNVLNNKLKLNDVAYITNQIHQGMLRSEVFPHDVLYNITGASIGRCCAVPYGLGKANVNQHVCILRVPNATGEDAIFLSYVLSSPIGKNQLDALTTCGNRQGLNYQQLGNYMVPWPDFEERKRISHIILQNNSQTEHEERYLSKLLSLKSGLTADLLTGRVRVPETVSQGATTTS